MVSGHTVDLDRMQALLSALKIEQSPRLMAAPATIQTTAPASVAAGGSIGAPLAVCFSAAPAPSVTFSGTPILLPTVAQPSTSAVQPPTPTPLSDKLQRELHQRQEAERHALQQRHQEEEQEALQAIQEDEEIEAARDWQEQEEFSASAPYALRPLCETAVRPA
eukprot:1101072-Pleurochrysis_carterae.AAC.1